MMRTRNDECVAAVALLAPVFLFSRWVGYSPLSFHLSFWTGMLLGTLLALGAIPPGWAIGDGKYALLLGTNLYGLGLCMSGFLLPLAFGRRLSRGYGGAA